MAASFLVVVAGNVAGSPGVELLGVALGSSTQIALFVIPVMVVIGWIIQQPLDLFFGPFPTAVTFLSTNLVFMVVQNGATNWLEGAMLLFSYAIICFSFLFY